jgi:hypothetical protein
LFFNLASLTEAKRNETPEALADETTSRLKHGLFCSNCAQRMTWSIEIDGSVSFWML